MSRKDRKRLQPRGWDVLEPRQLLAAPVILGNTGQILTSQFQPFVVRSTVTGQFRDVKSRGPIKFDVVNPGSPTGAVGLSSSPPPNSGLIKSSQFNGGGFLTVGLQFDHVDLGGGLMVSGFDNENNGAATPATSVSRSPDIDPDTFRLPTLANAGLVSNSQYNDGGFGILERNSAGKIFSREGRVGFQWRNTRVDGPVNVGLGVEVDPAWSIHLVCPPSRTPCPAGSGDASTSSSPTSTVINFITNMGQIAGSQFNDGGFGDIGMQWSNVDVGGRVATSSNTLFITPQQDNYPAITVQNQVFGQSAAGASVDADANTLSNDAVGQSAAMLPSPRSMIPHSDDLRQCADQQRATRGSAIQRWWVRRRRAPVEEGQRRRQRDGGPQLADSAAQQQRSGSDHGAGDPVSQHARACAAAAAGTAACSPE